MHPGPNTQLPISTPTKIRKEAPNLLRRILLLQSRDPIVARVVYGHLCSQDGLAHCVSVACAREQSFFKERHPCKNVPVVYSAGCRDDCDSIDSDCLAENVRVACHKRLSILFRKPLVARVQIQDGGVR